jgi:hypothetical protein
MMHSWLTFSELCEFSSDVRNGAMRCAGAQPERQLWLGRGDFVQGLGREIWELQAVPVCLLYWYA